MVAQALAAQGGLVLEMPNEPLAIAPLPLPAMVSLAAVGHGGAGDAGAGNSQLLQLPEVNSRTQLPSHGVLLVREACALGRVRRVRPGCGQLMVAAPWTPALRRPAAAATRASPNFKLQGSPKVE